MRIDRDKLASLMRAEADRFVRSHQRSYQLFAEGSKDGLLAGVPMNWMKRWPGGFPLYVDWAAGARFGDADGHEYIDLCLGDTGAMTGHSPPAAVEAVSRQVERGVTSMLPTADSVWVGKEMARRFGPPFWQFTLTATDANRFVVRLARHLTGRPKILVFNGCYHGSVDETIVRLEDGHVYPRRGSVGPPVDPSLTTRVVEFNDLAALESELAHGDVACVLAEPVMTNVGIVLPEPGFHAELRRLATESGTLLVIDETHTLCCGPGGYTADQNLTPDAITMGKPIGSGVPSGAYGLSAVLAERVNSSTSVLDADVGGVGGTLAGNALSMAAIRSTLDQVLTTSAYEHMIEVAESLERGVRSVIDDYDLPWHVTRLGCRVEYRFQPDRPRSGGEAGAAEDPELDAFMHLFLLNRGILLTPFHNMTLTCPASEPAHAQRHTEVFEEAVAALL